MLETVKQVTIQPLIEAVIIPGTLVYTDEYSIYNRLEKWGYRHKSVCHGAGEYVRDEEGDGFHEVHVNTMEGFWSLLRSEFFKLVVASIKPLLFVAVHLQNALDSTRLLMEAPSFLSISCPQRSGRDFFAA